MGRLYSLNYPCDNNSRIECITENDLETIIAALKMQQHLKNIDNTNLINRINYVKGTKYYEEE